MVPRDRIGEHAAQGPRILSLCFPCPGRRVIRSAGPLVSVLRGADIFLIGCRAFADVVQAAGN